MDHTTDNLPWVIIKIAKNNYAIHSKLVIFISKLSDDITQIPASDQHIRGLINFRGEAIVAVGLRSVFGKISIKDEMKEFMDVLDQCEEEHSHWVQKLQESVDNNETFSMTTDPHRCNFGMWYDNFESNDNELLAHMKKIELPHKLIHEAAQIINKKEKSDKQVTQILDAVKNQYMPQVIGLIEQSKTIFLNNTKEMLVVIEDKNGDKIGLIVDEVLGVHNITEKIEKTGMEYSQHSKFISGVFSKDMDDKQTMILTIDSDEIVNVGRSIH